MMISCESYLELFFFISRSSLSIISSNTPNTHYRRLARMNPKCARRLYWGYDISAAAADDTTTYTNAFGDMASTHPFLLGTTEKKKSLCNFVKSTKIWPSNSINYEQNSAATTGGSGLSSSVLVSSNRPQPELQIILPPNLPDRALMQIFRSFSRDTAFEYYVYFIPILLN